MLSRTVFVFLEVLNMVLLVRVVMSWFRPRYRTKSNGWFYTIEELVWRATEPFLAPIRNILPNMGGWDLSPLIAFFLIQLLSGFLVNALARAGL